MTKACSPTSMHVDVSSVNAGLKVNPSFAKNALLRSRSATGMFTNSMRPGCAGLVMPGLHSVARRRTSPKTCPPGGSHRWIASWGHSQDRQALADRPVGDRFVGVHVLAVAAQHLPQRVTAVP